MSKLMPNPPPSFYVHINRPLLCNDAVMQSRVARLRFPFWLRPSCVDAVVPPVLQQLPSRLHSQKGTFGLLDTLSGAGCLSLSVGLWYTGNWQTNKKTCCEFCQEDCFLALFLTEKYTEHVFFNLFSHSVLMLKWAHATFHVQLNLPVALECSRWWKLPCNWYTVEDKKAWKHPLKWK